MNAFDALAGWKLKAMLAALSIGALIGLYALGSHNSLAAERERMKPVIASYELRIARLLDQLRAADDRIATANAAVDQLKADADARAVKAAAEIKAAKSLADRYRLRAAQIAAARPTGDQCVASRELIRTTLSEERK